MKEKYVEEILALEYKNLPFCRLSELLKQQCGSISHWTKPWSAGTSTGKVEIYRSTCPVHKNLVGLN